MYDWESVERLTVTSPAEVAGDDRVALPAIKVIQSDTNEVSSATRARFGDAIDLVQSDIISATAPMHAGDTFTVTLVYRALETPTTDLTRFIQLHSTEHGMAAQQDTRPRYGANPTNSWIPGEIIRDTALLTVDPTAQAGTYRLLTGFYDPATGERQPATDPAGDPLPDNTVLLGEIEVK
jgi:hypothetical protein